MQQLSNKFRPQHMLDSPLVSKLIALALEEDMTTRDITTRLTVDFKRKAKAKIIAKEPLMVCGLPIVKKILSSTKNGLRLKVLVPEGKFVKKGASIVEISGRAQELLRLERTILNFMQRLSGIATFTHGVCSNTQTIRVLDTRKTTPGLRIIEKYAVKIGGGLNHRLSLADMVLVKNNHIDANAGSVTQTLAKIYTHKPRGLKVEVEVRNILELKQALPFEPDIIMLDNFSNASIGAALKVISRSAFKPLVEVSGGINSKRMKQLEHLGVKLVSMGALTTQARWVDLSLSLLLL